MPVISITDMTPAGALSGVELVEVSQVSETVFVSGTTLSALAADNSINDSANGFLTAGFAVKDRVRVTGFTGAGVNNIFVGVITALTAGKMTFGGADGDVLVDDAAGELVRVEKWVTRRTTIGDIVDLAAGAGNTTLVVTLTGTAINLEAVQNSQYLRFTNVSPKSLTVRPESTEPMPDNAEWHIRNAGAGDLTIIEGAGVDIVVPNGGSLVIPEGGTATLKRVAEDAYDLLGQTVAA